MAVGGGGFSPEAQCGAAAGVSQRRSLASGGLRWACSEGRLECGGGRGEGCNHCS